MIGGATEPAKAYGSASGFERELKKVEAETRRKEKMAEEGLAREPAEEVKPKRLTSPMDPTKEQIETQAGSITSLYDSMKELEAKMQLASHIKDLKADQERERMRQQILTGHPWAITPPRWP